MANGSQNEAAHFPVQGQLLSFMSVVVSGAFDLESQQLDLRRQSLEFFFKLFYGDLILPRVTHEEDQLLEMPE